MVTPIPEEYGLVYPAQFRATVTPPVGHNFPYLFGLLPSSRGVVCLKRSPMSTLLAEALLLPVLKVLL